MQFCRPNSWRDRLDELAHERGVTLNVALEADSLSLQTHMVADGGVYALLGPLRGLRGIEGTAHPFVEAGRPRSKRHIALAMSRHGELTLACRTVMQVAREIAKSGAAVPALDDI